MDKDWKVSPITKEMKNTAWSQLGTLDREIILLIGE